MVPVVIGKALFGRMIITKGLVLAYYEPTRGSPEENDTCNLDVTKGGGGSGWCM